jgi:hypothetical protein
MHFTAAEIVAADIPAADNANRHRASMVSTPRRAIGSCFELWHQIIPFHIAVKCSVRTPSRRLCAIAGAS